METSKGPVVAQAPKPLIEKHAERMKRLKMQEVWLCTQCGAEHKVDPPYEKGCQCGNVDEDAYRLKEARDYEDQKAGRPLVGVASKATTIKLEDVPRETPGEGLPETVVMTSKIEDQADLGTVDPDPDEEEDADPDEVSEEELEKEGE